MSLIGDALIPYALISAQTRAIATLIPNIVTQELHRDMLVITDHPVETGAAISDHAFMRPPEVEMICGWSNSSAQSEGYVQAVYAEMLALQKSRVPFNVSTGKRQYSDMLVDHLIVTTDGESEFALNVIVGLKNIIRVNTSQTTGANGKSGSSTKNASDPAVKSADAGSAKKVAPTKMQGDFGFDTTINRMA